EGGRPATVGVDDGDLLTDVDGGGAVLLDAVRVEHVRGDAPGGVVLVRGHGGHRVVGGGEQRRARVGGVVVGAVLLVDQTAGVVEGVGQNPAAVRCRYLGLPFSHQPVE